MATNSPPGSTLPCRRRLPNSTNRGWYGSAGICVSSAAHARGGMPQRTRSAGISSISRSSTTRSGWCRRANSRPFSARPAARVRTPRRSSTVCSTSRVSCDRSTISTLRCPFKAIPSVANRAETSLSRPKGEKDSDRRRKKQSEFVGHSDSLWSHWVSFSFGSRRYGGLTAGPTFRRPLNGRVADVPSAAKRSNAGINRVLPPENRRETSVPPTVRLGTRRSPPSSRLPLGRAGRGR